jgi:tRNA wybutosine-synthesizing protein 1
LNIIEPVNYAKLIKKAKPDFVEVKAFMSVGFARQRLAYERMPLHPEIVEFTKNLAKLTNLKILDEKKESRVVLLGKSRENLKIKNP